MRKNRILTTVTRFLTSIRVQYIIPVIAILAMPTIALAQTANNVTLRFANGQDSISGTLTNFEDNKFFINASIGLVVIPTDGVDCVGAACPEQTRPELANARITLTAKDGSASMSGDLIIIEDNEYVIATAVGVQRIATELVNCEGERCRAARPAPPVDKTVVLTGGGNVLKGELLGFENETYILETALMGEIRVSAVQFACRGAVCP